MRAPGRSLAQVRARVQEAREWLAETFDLAEKHFWEPAAELYGDEAKADWTLLPYRGQNANMHACEALIAAFEADLDRIVDGLTPARLETAAQLAEVPQAIRGYGHVKEASLAPAKAEAARLWSAWEGG